MVTPEAERAAQVLRESIEAFEREHPEIVEAMKVMGVTLPQYLQTLAALRGIPSVTTGTSS